MNIGTYQGDLAEKSFVKHFNQNKNYYMNYINNFENIKSLDNIWMIQVTTKQFSELSQRKVSTRADAYLIQVDTDIRPILEKYDSYLSEEILSKNSIIYHQIPYSGVSIKMSTSKSFQILKTGPDSFYNLFNSYELGAGASLYCTKENELYKNIQLIEGWHTTVEEMVRYFNTFTNNNYDFPTNKEICKAIKEYCNKQISDLIYNSKNLQLKIFNGINLYEEPYTAHYFYQNKNIEKLSLIPFTVTTGSGRSKGDYTIVLKPTKND